MAGFRRWFDLKFGQAAFELAEEPLGGVVSTSVDVEAHRVRVEVLGVRVELDRAFEEVDRRRGVAGRGVVRDELGDGVEGVSTQFFADRLDPLVRVAGKQGTLAVVESVVQRGDSAFRWTALRVAKSGLEVPEVAVEE